MNADQPSYLACYRNPVSTFLGPEIRDGPIHPIDLCGFRGSKLLLLCVGHFNH